MSEQPQYASFRDENGRLHRWPYTRMSEAKDGRKIITRLNADGSSYGSTTRRPGQYFVPAERIIRIRDTSPAKEPICPKCGAVLPQVPCRRCGFWGTS